MKTLVIIYLIIVALNAIVSLLFFKTETGKAMIKAYDDWMPISAELLYLLFDIFWPFKIIYIIYSLTVGRTHFDRGIDIIEEYKDK